MSDFDKLDTQVLPVPAAARAYVPNAKQAEAIHYGDFRKSFCLIGAAGTGKTTTLKAMIMRMIENNRIQPLEISTDNLSMGAPGIALISFTQRAVRNIRRQMPDELKSHCLTYHKLLEFQPEQYEEYDETKGEMVRKMRFVPSRHSGNPLPKNLTTIVVDESSMPSIDLHNLLLDALPNPSQVQFIFLGDLNQLPPVYGDAILGKALLDLPIIELTEVYRQALESPIISIALAIKNNDFRTVNAELKDGTFQVTVTPPKGKADDWNRDIRSIPYQVEIKKEGRGKVTIFPWRQKLDMEEGLSAVCSKLRAWMREGFYDPDQDMLLCPWVKAFGTTEINNTIADFLGKRREAEVWEVISGFNKFYFAEGDRIVVNKMDAEILQISRNPRYYGLHPLKPSKTLNRWGHDPKGSSIDDTDESDVDAILEAAASEVSERTTEASHVIRVRIIDTNEVYNLTKAAELNNTYFGYALSVHKSQGSEWRRVFFISHYCHAAMLSRELVYTGFTRAAEELVVLQSPRMLDSAACKPRIKGDSLAAKLEFFKARLAEAMSGKKGSSDDE